MLEAINAVVRLLVIGRVLVLWFVLVTVAVSGGAGLMGTVFVAVMVVGEKVVESDVQTGDDLESEHPEQARQACSCAPSMENARSHNID